jgi:hypothetical protein
MQNGTFFLSCFTNEGRWEEKSGILKAGELALDGIGDPFRGDRGVNVREVIAAQLRARLRGRGGGH